MLGAIAGRRREKPRGTPLRLLKQTGSLSSSPESVDHRPYYPGDADGGNTILDPPVAVLSDLRQRRPVKVNQHRRVVAACCYAFLVKMLDMPHDSMVADPNGIVAPSRALRGLPPPGPMSDSQRPARSDGPKPVHLIGVNDEPAAQRVLEIVRLARAEQKIISRLAEQPQSAGVPVRTGFDEVGRVDQRSVGIGAEQQWPILRRQPESEGDCLPRLDDSMVHARREHGNSRR